MSMIMKPYILWGAGETCRIQLEQLKKYNIEFQIEKIVDNDPSLVGAELYGKIIEAPESLLANTGNINIIMMSLDDEMKRSISKQLEEMGVTQPYELMTMQEVFTPLIFEHTGRVELFVNSVIISTRCTMNCKHCSTMVPFIKDKENHSEEEIKHWLDNYFELVDYVRIINIYGGEPLVHPQLDKVIQLMLSYQDRFEQLVMTTNATILPKKSVLDLCQKHHILYQISDYGNMHPKFLDTLDEYKIPYMVRSIDNWFELFNPQRDVEDDVAMQTYHRCDYSIYHPQLYKNKIFACPIVKGLFASGRDRYYCENDYFECGNENVNLMDRKQQFIEFSNGKFEKGFISSCKHCYGTNKEHIVPVAEQI